MVLGERWLFSIGNGAEISAPREGQKMPRNVGVDEDSDQMLDP